MIDINCPYCNAILQSDIDEDFDNPNLGMQVSEFRTCIQCKKEMKVSMHVGSNCYVEAFSSEDEEEMYSYDMENQSVFDDEDYEFTEEDLEYAELFGIDIDEHHERKDEKKENYSELLKKHDFKINAISYAELLNTVEWQKKRQFIIDRDYNTCKHCEKESEKHNLTLHVHHKYYIKDYLPWNYKSEVFMTLCEQCHWDLHQKTLIRVFELIDGKLAPIKCKVCERCNGAGRFPQYSHVDNGICFECGGKPYIYDKVFNRNGS